MLIKADKHPIKNPVWQISTPNELYENGTLSEIALGFRYADKVAAWNKTNKISSKNLWFEVRIINEKSELDIPDFAAWWKKPWFMDRIFWVYQTPMVAQIEGKTALFYYLEMFEGIRVLTETMKRTGKNHYGTLEPSLMLPVKCAHIALFNEWKAGVSEHKRERPDEEPKSQIVIDKEARLKEETERILKDDAFELSEEQSKKYFGDLEKEKTEREKPRQQ